MENFYDILGISDTASDDEIKTAYRKLAVKHHPDKNPGDINAEEEFKRINSAYQTLSDPNKKWRYDQLFFRDEEIETQTYYDYADSVDQTSRRKRSRPKPPPVYKGTNKRSYYESGSEWRGWVWAMGVIISGILLIGGPMAVFEYIEIKEKNNKKIIADKLIKKTEYYKDKKKYRLALKQMDKIVKVDPYFNQYNYAKEIGSDIKKDARTSFNNKDYGKTIEYLNIFKDNFEQNKKGDLIYFTLAESYAALGLIEEAENIIAELKLKEDKLYITKWALLNAKAKIAIHDGKINKAKGIYRNAIKEITKGYIKDYGKAYFFTMNPKNQPEDHFQLFYGKIITDIKTGDLNEALKSIKWALSMRPYRPEVYFQKGIIFYQQGKKKEGCNNWKKAIKLGLKSKTAIQKIKDKGCIN